MSHKVPALLLVTFSTASCASGQGGRTLSESAFSSTQSPAYRLLEAKQASLKLPPVGAAEATLEHPRATRYTSKAEQTLIDAFTFELRSAAVEATPPNAVQISNPITKIAKIGFLPTECFAAASVRVEFEYLIAAQSGIDTWAKGLAFLLLNNLPRDTSGEPSILSEQDVRKFVASRRDLSDHLIVLMLMSSLGGLWTKFDPQAITIPSNTIRRAEMDELVHGLMLFVLAHEFAHVLNGDLDGTPATKIVPLFAKDASSVAATTTKAGDVALVDFATQSELSADARAASLFLQVLGTRDGGSSYHVDDSVHAKYPSQTEAGYAAGDVFLRYLAIHERLWEKLGLPPRDSRHPSADSRLKIYLSAMRDHKRRQIARLRVIDGRDITDVLVDTLEELWLQAEPTLEDKISSFADGVSELARCPQ